MANQAPTIERHQAHPMERCSRSRLSLKEHRVIDYQLYFLGDDDRDVDRQDHRCADDRAAVLTGRSLCFENNIDIWQGTRRVARVSRGDFRLALRAHSG